MAKLTVDITQAPAAGKAVLLRDGEPLEGVSQFGMILDAQGPESFIIISRPFIRDGAVFKSTVCHDIKSMSLTVEYEEGE